MLQTFHLEALRVDEPPLYHLLAAGMDAAPDLWYHCTIMGALPPGLLILAIAALSAFAGAIVTWLVLSVAGGGNHREGHETRGEEESPTRDLLRVVESSSGPIVLVRGKQRRHLQEIKDREAGEETVAAIRAILAFAEGWLPAMREDRTAPVAVRRSRPATPLREARPARKTVTSSATSGSEASSDLEPLKLVEEIDALLQQRLVERPELARMGIRLSQDIEGRLLIYVGSDRFRSTQNIPDPEVRAFIRDTIQMWELR